ncbi:MAG: questin oxidase family protein [Tepidiformaceae bacterium]
MITIDESLERFAGCGSEFRGGLSNHGPMAADALIALGRGEAVAAWVERYITRLDEPARGSARIESGEWRAALGDYARLGDWEELFARELAEKAWTTVLQEWTPRLAPGFLAGATHGMLRTAHAVRGLSGGETPARVAELGRGLAYWAARYYALPEAPAAQTLALPESLKAIPVVPAEERRGGRFITTAVAQLAERPEFAPAANLLDTSGDISELLSAFTAAFAGIYLENAATSPIAFIHSVTAPSAIRLLAPHIAPETTRDLVRYGWQAGAAFIAVYSQPNPPAPPTPVDWSEDDLADRAVASGDEHAIKFTEACLREHRISPNPIYLAAAADVSARLRA